LFDNLNLLKKYIGNIQSMNSSQLSNMVINSFGSDKPVSDQKPSSDNNLD